jgi:3-oxoacyl-[acyl-carrier-protein] synthase-3
MYRNVLVIGVEVLSRFLDWEDRNTCVLFGDGAGAVILSASDQPGGLLGIDLFSDGTGCEGIIVPAGGSARPASAETVAAKQHTIRMLGREVYKYATRQLADSAIAALRAADMTVDQVDQFVFHQANLRIIEHVQKVLSIPGRRRSSTSRSTATRALHRCRWRWPKRSPPDASSRAIGS